MIDGVDTGFVAWLEGVTVLPILDGVSFSGVLLPGPACRPQEGAESGHGRRAEALGEAGQLGARRVERRRPGRLRPARVRDGEAGLDPSGADRAFGDVGRVASRKEPAAAARRSSRRSAR